VRNSVVYYMNRVKKIILTVIVVALIHRWTLAQCGDWGFFGQDINEDCVVNLRDFPDLTSLDFFSVEWLDCSLPETPGCQDKRSNIVFILADDLGWMDLSGGDTTFGLGSDFYETPRLQELASQGMSFTNYYTCGPTCAPTRGAILTGMYAPRTNMYTVESFSDGALGNASNQTFVAGRWLTLAETLKTAGYTTATFGKYHVESRNNNDPNSSPEDQGFDLNFGGGTAGGLGNYFADENGVFGNAIGPKLDAYASPGEHVTDAITDAIIDFINQHKDNRFFMLVSHYAVHVPIPGMGRPDLVAKYQAKQLANPSQIGHDDVDYAALVEGLDESVGRVMDHLEATFTASGQKLADKTIFVFCSDNGGANVTNNAPLRGAKGRLNEGGIRVPMIIRQSGYVPSGAKYHTPVNSVDFYPTFAKMAGATFPDPSQQPLDGVDIQHILRNPNAGLPREAIFWHFPGYANRQDSPTTVIRKGDYKLQYLYETGRYRLYNVATPDDDIGEANNLAATMPEKVTELATDMVNWLGTIIAWDGDNTDDMPLESNGQLVPLPPIP